MVPSTACRARNQGFGPQNTRRGGHVRDMCMPKGRMGLEAPTPTCTPKPLSSKGFLIYRTQINWIHSESRDVNCKAIPRDISYLILKILILPAINTCIRYKHRQGTFHHGFNQRIKVFWQMTALLKFL